VIDGLSLKTYSPALNLNARLAFWLFTLLVLTRFSPVSAGLTVLVVSAQVFIGFALLVAFRITDKLSALSRIGLGFCLGAILSTLVYVLVVTVTAVFAAVCSQIVLLCLAHFAQRKLIKPDQLPIELEEIAIVKWLAVAALVGLSPEWFWPLPVAGFLVVVFVGWNAMRSKSLWLRFTLISLWAGVGVFIWQHILITRPNRPWFPDDQFGEIWSHSLGKWGLSHNPMLMGESISYHWLSFAWVGLLSNLTSVNVDIALTLFAPIVVAVACSVIGFSIVRSFVKSSKLAVLVLCIAFVVDTERFFRGFGFHAFQLSSFSQFFSFCLGLGITLVVVKIELQTSTRNVFLITLMLFGVVGSKISSGATVFCGLVFMLVYQIFLNTAAIKKSIIFIVVSAFAFLLSFIFFLGNPKNGSTSVIRRPGWTVGNIGDLVHVYNSTLIRYLPILSFLILALGGLGLLTLLNINNVSAIFGTHRVVGPFLVGCYLASLSQMWVAQADGSNTIIADSDNTLYAYQFITAISILIGVSVFVGMFENPLVQNVGKKFVISFAVLALFVVWGSRHLMVEFSGSYATPFFTSLRPALPFLIGFIMALLAYSAWRSKRRLGFIDFVATFSVASLVIAGGYIFIANYVSRAPNQQAEWRTLDNLYVISADVSSATGWIKQHVDKNEIVSMKVQRQSISVLTERRDFVGFPITIRLAGLNSDLEILKRKQVDRFAISGDCTSAQSLNDYGVSFFLVDLTNVQTPEIERCADEVYRNETIVIYSFN
jgi:hypothetical protein